MKKILSQLISQLRSFFISLFYKFDYNKVEPTFTLNGVEYYRFKEVKYMPVHMVTILVSLLVKLNCNIDRTHVNIMISEIKRLMVSNEKDANNKIFGHILELEGRANWVMDFDTLVRIVALLNFELMDFQMNGFSEKEYLRRVDLFLSNKEGIKHIFNQSIDLGLNVVLLDIKSFVDYFVQQLDEQARIHKLLGLEDNKLEEIKKLLKTL